MHATLKNSSRLSPEATPCHLSSEPLVSALTVPLERLQLSEQLLGALLLLVAGRALVLEPYLELLLADLRRLQLGYRQK